jgi:hypothetical protein
MDPQAEQSEHCNSPQAQRRQEPLQWALLVDQLRPLLQRTPLTLSQAEMLYELAEVHPLSAALIESVAATVLRRRLRRSWRQGQGGMRVQACLTDTWCLASADPVFTELVYGLSEELGHGVNWPLERQSGRLAPPTSPAVRRGSLDPEQPLICDIWSRCGELEPERVRMLGQVPDCCEAIFLAVDWPVEPHWAAIQLDGDEQHVFDLWSPDDGGRQ